MLLGKDSHFNKFLHPYALVFTGVVALSFILFWYLGYNQVFNNYPSDLLAHIQFVDQYISGDINIPHPGFQLLIYWFGSLLGFDYEYIAILLFSIFNVFLLFVISYILKLYGVSGWLNLIAVLVLMFSGTLPTNIIFDWQYHHYAGNGSLSLWHNPTTTLLKPLAFLSFFILFAVLENKLDSKYLVICFFSTALGAFVKPSFIVVFLPILFLLYFCFLIKENKIKFFGCMRFGVQGFYNYKKGFKVLFFCVVFFCSFVLLWQYISVYGNDGSDGVGFFPFAVWSIYTGNIFLSILIANLFSVLFLVFAYNIISLRTLFAFFMFVGGILLFALLAELGSRFSHGNFSWSYFVAMHILYLSVVLDFINNFKRLKVIVSLLFVSALFIQFLSGVYYFSRIYSGYSYM